MAKKRTKRPEFPSIPLTAKVNRPYSRPPWRATQEQMCEMFDVSARTLREWHQIGLPKEMGEDGAPVYPFPAANVWVMCYQTKVRTSPNRKGPRHLTVEQADDWHLEHQAELGETEFALV